MRNERKKTGNGQDRRARRSPILALTNKVRVDLLFCLAGGEKNVTELMRELGIGQTRASHGLRFLADAGFITVRKDGNYRYYTLDRRFSEPFLVAIDQARWKRMSKRS